MNNENNYRRQIGNATWQCLLCFRQSNTRAFASYHIKSHRSCDRCGKHFAGQLSSNTQIKQHLKSCKGVRKTTCHFCGTLMPNKKLYNRDWKKHTAICIQNPDNFVGPESVIQVKKEILGT
jgi:hypothetical protein